MKVGNIGNNLIKMFFKKREGLAQIPLLIGLMIMAVAIPVATKLVQQNQESRSKAAYVEEDKIAEKEYESKKDNEDDCDYDKECKSNNCVLSASIRGKCKPATNNVAVKKENGESCIDGTQCSSNICEIEKAFMGRGKVCVQKFPVYTKTGGCTPSDGFYSSEANCDNASSSSECFPSMDECGDYAKLQSTGTSDNKTESNVNKDTTSETNTTPATKQKFVVYRNNICQDSSGEYVSVEACDAASSTNTCYKDETDCLKKNPGAKSSSGVGGANPSNTSDAGIPKVTVRYDVTNFSRDGKVIVYADCTNCHHSALFVNGKWVETKNEKSTNYVYTYIVEKADEYKFVVKACSIDSSKTGNVCPSANLAEAEGPVLGKLEPPAATTTSTKRTFGVFMKNVCQESENSYSKVEECEAASNANTCFEDVSVCKKAHPEIYPVNTSCQKCANGKDRSIGDANCDGSVDITDGSILRREKEDSKMTVGTFWAADFNCDGVVNQTDKNTYLESYKISFK